MLRRDAARREGRLASATAPLPWPLGAGSPGSWLRCALGQRRCTAQGPIEGCGAAVRPGQSRRSRGVPHPGDAPRSLARATARAGLTPPPLPRGRPPPSARDKPPARPANGAWGRSQAGPADRPFVCAGPRNGGAGRWRASCGIGVGNTARSAADRRRRGHLNIAHRSLNSYYFPRTTTRIKHISPGLNT